MQAEKEQEVRGVISDLDDSVRGLGARNQEVEDLKCMVEESNRTARALDKKVGRFRSEYIRLYDVYNCLYDEHEKVVKHHNEMVENHNKAVAQIKNSPFRFLDPSKLDRRPGKSGQVSVIVPTPRSQLFKTSADKPIQKAVTETSPTSGESSEDLESQDKQTVGSSPLARSRPSSVRTGIPNLEEGLGTNLMIGSLLNSMGDLGLQDRSSIRASPPTTSQPSSLSVADTGTPQGCVPEHVVHYDEPEEPRVPRPIVSRRTDSQKSKNDTEAAQRKKILGKVDLTARFSVAPEQFEAARIARESKLLEGNPFLGRASGLSGTQKRKEIAELDFEKDSSVAKRRKDLSNS